MNHEILFDDASLPSWLPDEIVYSLASRFHRLSCNPVASRTSQQLFGSARRGYQHDFPSALDQLSVRTAGRLGSAPDIVRHHTILPFFLPLRSPSDALEAHAAVARGEVNSLKFRLGILTSRFGAHHPLKACRVCMNLDRAANRIAHWRRDHQFPGVWLCLDHRAPLVESIVKSTGVGRFQWYLPEESELRQVLPERLTCDSQAKELNLFVRLASASKALAQLHEFHFDQTLLLNTYRIALTSRNLVTANGSLRAKMVGKEFSDFAAPLRAAPELQALPANESEATSQVARLLRLPRTGTHPLRHLVLILWLFDDWDNFWNAYAKTGEMLLSQSLPKMEPSAHASSRDAQLRELMHLVCNQNVSISLAATSIGIDVTTAMVWLTKVGIGVKKRPKVLKDATRNSIVTALREGTDKQRIADQMNVSIQAITRTLRTEIGLQQAWNDQRKERASKAARNEWLSMSTAYPAVGAKALRMLAPAAFSWLYRNERGWLREQLAKLPVRQRTNNSNINWDQRDEEMSRAVQAVSFELSLLKPAVRITIASLCQRLPSLKAKLGALDRMPLTQRALAIAVGKQRAVTSKSLI